MQLLQGMLYQVLPLPMLTMSTFLQLVMTIVILLLLLPRLVPIMFVLFVFVIMPTVLLAQTGVMIVAMILLRILVDNAEMCALILIALILTHEEGPLIQRAATAAAEVIGIV